MQADKVSKRIVELKKQRSQEAASAAKTKALQAVEAKAAGGALFFVIPVKMPASMAAKTLPEVVAAVKQTHGDKPCMLLAPDTDAGKCMVYAEVPKAVVKQLPAGEWLKAALAPLGGKGGGKPDRAQGSGPSVDKLDEAVHAAEAFASGKV
jgi:alanyl-tRNA synthetase